MLMHDSMQIELDFLVNKGEAEIEAAAHNKWRVADDR